MKIFKKIWNGFLKIIDSIIVMPLTKLIYKITGKKEKNGKLLETLFTKPTALLFISLAMAILIFIAVDQKIIKFSDSSAEVFKGQSVNVVYNEEAYVVEGLPETVDVTLIGSKADLYIAKQSSNHSVTVDLTGLEPGTHKVNIEYEHGSKSIEYSVNPSVATVIIYEKVSDSRKISYDILNEDVLDKKYVIDKVDLVKDEITIRGPQYKLDEVASVKALIDIKDLPNVQAGKQTIENVKLKAYDKTGNVVDVEFVPETISADIEISAPSKEVNLNFVPNGNMPFGKAISSYSFSSNKVTIYGTSSVINAINDIDINVDVSKLNSSTTLDVDIPKPTGVRTMSQNNIKVKIDVTDVAAKSNVYSINLTGINTPEGLVAQPIDENNGVIEVEVKGAQSVLDSIQAADITAYVDLTGLTEGEHELNVKVKGTNTLATYIAKKTKVKVKLARTS